MQQSDGYICSWYINLQVLATHHKAEVKIHEDGSFTCTINIHGIPITSEPFITVEATYGWLSGITTFSAPIYQDDPPEQCFDRLQNTIQNAVKSGSIEKES